LTPFAINIAKQAGKPERWSVLFILCLVLPDQALILPALFLEDFELSL
jgi:hypothetical protein